jgi:hypothetical protein
VAGFCYAKLENNRRHSLIQWKSVAYRWREKKVWWRMPGKIVLHEEHTADGKTSTTSIWSAGKHFEEAERWIRFHSFGKTSSHVCKVFSSKKYAHSLIQWFEY